MIEFYTGNLLTSGVDLIAHQCNLQGVFGGGIAYQIKQKMPKAEDFCANKKNSLGDVIFALSESMNVANCFSQTKDFETDYKAVKDCFSEIIRMSKKLGFKTIGVPYKYGCGIAKGNWETVLSIFEELFKDETDLILEVWRFQT